MSQRINLQFSIEVDELEGETSRLIGKASDSLARLSATANDLAKRDADALTLSNLDAIGELRQKMATIDHQLSDVSNIIKGYLSYRTTDPPAEETAPQEFTSEEDIPEEVYEDAKIVSDIQNRIQEFKQNQLNYNMNQISNEQDTSQEQTESEQIS